MVNKAKSTQFRKLEVSATAGDAGPWTKISQLNDTNFVTGSAQFLEVTNYDSDKKEYIGGLDDSQDMTVQFQRVVDDPGQNIVRDACFAKPRPTLYFKGTTGQGETMSFTSEVGGWQVTGGANAVEMGQVTVRPRDTVWGSPKAGG